MERHIKTKSSLLCCIEKEDAVVNVLNISLYGASETPKSFLSIQKTTIYREKFYSKWRPHCVYLYLSIFPLCYLNEIFVGYLLFLDSNFKPTGFLAVSKLIK